MKSKLLIAFSSLFLFVSINKLKAQAVTVLNGETPKDVSHQHVYSGDFTDGGFYGTSVNFNRGKGMLSVSFQFQSNGIETWDDLRLAFNYGGTWYYICAATVNSSNYTGNNYQTNNANNPTGSPSVNYFTSGTSYPTATVASNPGITYYKINENNWSGNSQSIYLYNYGALKRYNGNYNAVGGDIQNRSTTADDPYFSLQTSEYSGNQLYPVSCSPAAGNPTVNTGIPCAKYSWYGNLPGGYVISADANHECLLLNITNLPVEMLESQNFRVHLYAQGNTNVDNSIYETVYSNNNFMVNPPTGVTASNDQCGKVALNWGNSSANVYPTDGNVTLKTVIFRNGAYLATVANTATSYDDNTAAQDVIYGYTLRHVAFSESGQTYYRTPPTSNVNGQVKPSPDQPISPSATTSICTGEVDLSWSYTTSNPQFFRIDTAYSAAGTFATLANNIPGTSRNYQQTSAVRGRKYYYKIYSISSCGVPSLTGATCDGISPSDPVGATGLTLTQTADQHGFILSWKDNANNESQYQVVRQESVGGPVSYQVSAAPGTGSTLTYTDSAIAVCKSYTYRVNVFNSCVANGVLSAVQLIGQLPPPDLATTFNATHKLVGSKGFFGNRVELNWTNNNNNVLHLLHIYRKMLGSASAATEIGSVQPGTGVYIDNTCDAGVFYQYSIAGEALCGATSLYSDTVSDVGFRSPQGLINGQVQYAGGIAVKGVQIIASRTAAGNGFSAVFSGSNEVDVPSTSNLSPTTALTLEAYVKFNTLGASNQIIFGKGTSYGLVYDGASGSIRMQVSTGGTVKTAQIPVTGNITAGSFYHIAGVYDGANLQLFINGLLVKSISVTGTIDVVANQLVIGKGLAGNLKELRVWDVARISTDIFNNYDNILSGTEPGLALLYHTDENAGTDLYDISKTGSTYNRNDGTFSSTPACVCRQTNLNFPLVGVFGLNQI
jgi:hypothetical protein